MAYGKILVDEVENSEGDVFDLSHSSLTGTSDENSHPASAISTESGKAVQGDIDNVNENLLLKSINPTYDIKPIELVYSDALGAGIVSGGEFKENKASVSSVTGLVGQDDNGYYITLDKSLTQYVECPFPFNANGDWTASVTVSHLDEDNPSDEPFVMSMSPINSDEDNRSFGLVIGDTLQLWRRPDLIDIQDVDYRDGEPHTYTMSYQLTTGTLTVAVDNVTVFSRPFNNVAAMWPNADGFVFGGYSSGASARQINGNLYGGQVWSAYTADIVDASKSKQIQVESKRDSSETIPDGVGMKPGDSESYLDMEFVDVHLILGQSNAAGRGLLTDITDSSSSDRQYAELTSLGYKIPNVFIGNSGDTFGEIIELGVNHNFGADGGLTMFGPEVAMALSAYRSGKKSVLIRHAEGSTSLYTDWDPYDGSEGSTYTAAITTITDSVNALIAKNYIPVLRTITWMQGERDARGLDNGDPSTYYETYLSELITNIKSTFNSLVSSYSSHAAGSVDGCRIIIPDIKIGTTAESNYPYADEVNAAHQSYADSEVNAVTVSTANFPQKTDDLHFDGEGQMMLGEGIMSAISKVRVV